MTTACVIKRSFAGLALLGLASGLGSTTAWGQTRATPPESGSAMRHDMSDMPMANCPMMAAMAQGPDGILKRRAEFNLTPDQVKQLEMLAARSKRASSEAMAGMPLVHARLDSLGRTERFDESAVRTAFDRMGTLHTQMGVALLSAQHEARSLLTPEQRGKLAAGSRGGNGMMGMDGMMGMMGKGTKGGMSMMDMSDCPMMKMPAVSGEGPRGSSGSSQSKASTPAPRKTTATPRDSAAPMDHHGHKPPTA